ncbi:MAG: DUF1294 domain-containing protein [Chitinophagales bacterium]
MTFNLLYPFLIFIAINSRAYYLMWKDKKTAKANNGMSGEGRISEASLFLTALLMGFVGIGFGMFMLRHKRRKSYFVWGVPLTAMYNVSLFFLLMEKLEEDYAWKFVFDLIIN